MQTEERLTLKFDGTNEISLETLRQCLDITLDTMKFVADRNLTDKDYCRMVVQDVRKGSFVIDIGLVVDIATGIITGISSLAGIVISIFKLRKHLKGKEPKKIHKEENGVKIENCEGNIISVNYATYNTYVIDNSTEKSLARFSEILAKDTERSGFTIERLNDKGEKLDEVTFTKDDLQSTATALDVEKFEDNITERYSNMWLKVSKAAYIGESKWEFITWDESMRISASIDDKAFLQKFRTSEIFLTPNTLLEVRLRSRVKTDESGNVTSKPIYSITQVLRLEDRITGKQISLFDE